MIPYAPEDPLGEDFSTETLNVIDSILSRIGLDDDGLGPNWSSTERIVHKFHMIDVWHRVKEVFHEVKQNPPQVIISSLTLYRSRKYRTVIRSSFFEWDSICIYVFFVCFVHFCCCRLMAEGTHNEDRDLK